MLKTRLLIGKRPLVVLVEPWGLGLRPKGCRQNLSITWAQVWNRAAIIAAEQRRGAASEVRKKGKVIAKGDKSSSMSVNKVILVGHLGNEPDVKYLASGVAICRFSLATNETFKNKAGDLEKRTEWHSIVAFGRLGEVCGEYLTTGRQVYIEGSIRTGKWKDRDGNERKSYDIVARYMQMLSPSGNGNGAKPKESSPTPVPQTSEADNPFREDEGSEQIPF